MLLSPRTSLTVAALCCVCFLGYASGADAPAGPGPLAARLAPSAIPDRVVLGIDSDPATSMAVTWRTDSSVKAAQAQILEADPGIRPESLARTVDADTTRLQTRIWEANYHNARFTGLKPESVYMYRVGAGDNWSEWFQFRTASSDFKPFSFVYFGDVQHGMRTLWSRVVRESIRHAPDANLMLFGGDLVTDGRDDLLWGDFFGAGGWMFASIPVLPTPGNHEHGGQDLTTHWVTQFSLPLNGISGQREVSYYLDYQGVRIICLNSVNQAAEQAPWLEEALKGAGGRWKIALFHYPLFGTAKDRGDNKRLIDAWKPLFDKHGVDLVLTGHDHTYARSGLIDGAVYLTSVSGGKMYELDRKPWMKRAAEQTQLFQVIRVDGSKLNVEARTSTGSLYDAFEISRSPGRGNKLVDKQPKGVPERTRQPAQR